MEGGEEAPVINQSDIIMPDVEIPRQSIEQEDPPPYSSIADAPSATETAFSIDEQVAHILKLTQEGLWEGQRGFVVSYKWLGRVLSRSTAAPPDGREFDKEASEGDIGNIDNSDIVDAAAFASGLTPFEGQSEHPFIPLLPGLTLGHEIEILPEEAWKHIVSWYGMTEGQLPILRIVHNTAPLGAKANMMFETYPPVFTIRKITPHANRLSSPPTPPTTSNTSETNTGTTTPEKANDAASIRIVASRTERFQSFLARSKTAAGISLKHKVKIWRQLNAAEISVEKADSQPGMLTPATSRSTSPSAPPASKSTQNLAIDPTTFAKWEEAIDYEGVDVQDETSNEKYNGKASLDTLALGLDQVLILEEQTRGPAGGEYVSDARRKAKNNGSAKSNDTAESRRSSPAPSAMLTRGRAKRDGRPRGVVGLTNLGNTCYMNSALQCISRVEELAWFFLDPAFKRQINTDNPLGYNGRMAKAYADLLAGLYSPTASSAFRPSGFKSALASAQPMFSGYGQQDSQEFLSFLVDALHEDLNRIQKKPYIENPDSDDATVNDPQAIRALGQTYQDNHRLRNDSIAMDLFNGFYKNTMVCPDCDKVSVTFDPYSLLTLQLPIENTWHGYIHFVPQTGTPASYEVDIDKNSTWRLVKQFIASKTPGLTRERLMFVELFNHKVYKVFSDGETIAESGIQTNDVLCMYELPDIPTNTSYTPKNKGYRSTVFRGTPDPPLPGMDSPLADLIAVPVMHCRGEKGNSPNLVLNPTFILVSRDEAKDYDTIFRKALAAVTSLTSRDFLNEFVQDRSLPSTEAKSSHDAALQANEDTPADTDADADTEARITDRSVPSEDGYVDVALQENSASQHQDGNASILTPGALIPPALRSMFEMKYVEANGEMFLTGNGHVGAMKPMQDRVQPQNRRRGSLESIRSTTSTRSHDSSLSAANQSSSSSDEDAPDPILGGQAGADFSGDVQSEDELSNTNVIPSKQTRRRDHQNKRDKKRGMTTYSRKGRRNSKHSVRSSASQASTAQPISEADVFYIRLGEGIVLDWHDDAFDALFGGNTSGDDMRGSFTFDPINMPLADDVDLRAKLNRRTQRAKTGIHLEDCFAETSRTEVLSEENAWYCNRCKELRRASKTLEIWTAPDILVVHLKRFSGERYRRDKIDVLVDFPLEGLDLSKRVGCKEDGKEYLYDLFAVDNHYGGLGGGHYTAYAKNFFDGKWYDFNGKLTE